MSIPKARQTPTQEMVQMSLRQASLRSMEHHRQAEEMRQMQKDLRSQAANSSSSSWGALSKKSDCKLEELFKSLR